MTDERDNSNYDNGSSDEDKEYADASRDDAAEGTDSGIPKDHLAEVSDGDGCTEIWEHLSQTRDRK